jgi:hypothetical protein
LPITQNSRTSGLTPSQAEDIDFETRLASYGNDERNNLNTNSRKLSKEERRRSKEEAGVDILYWLPATRDAPVSQTRSFGALAVRDRATQSRSDPEQASSEDVVLESAR